VTRVLAGSSFLGLIADVVDVRIRGEHPDQSLSPVGVDELTDGDDPNGGADPARSHLNLVSQPTDRASGGRGARRRPRSSPRRHRRSDPRRQRRRARVGSDHRSCPRRRPSSERRAGPRWRRSATGRWRPPGRSARMRQERQEPAGQGHCLRLAETRETPAMQLPRWGRGSNPVVRSTTRLADPSESGYTSRRPRSRTVSSIRSASAVVVLQLTKAGRNPTEPAKRVVPT
jgi:hypothetical protein